MKPSEFSDLVPKCCSEVLDTMYFTMVLDSVSLDALPESVNDCDGPLTFSLDFVGEISGRFWVHLQQATARSLAANFLGVEDADISSTEVNDVGTELANMLCGSVMSCVEGEHSFSLSPPQASSAAPTCRRDALVSILDTDGGSITVWVVLEGNHATVE